MDVRERITVFRQDIRLFDGQTLENADTDGLRESSEIPSITFALAKAAFVDEVGGIGDETAIIVSEIAPGHVAVVLSPLEDTFEVASGVAAIIIQVGVETQDIGFELSESRGGRVGDG
jgi:hypothetical protein